MISFDKTYQGWPPERIFRHVLYWGAWLFFYAIVNSTYHQDPMLVWIKVELVMMTIKVPFTYAIIYGLVPKFLYKKEYLKFFAAAIPLGALAGVGVWWLDLIYMSKIICSTCCTHHFWTTKIFYKSLDLIYTASLPTILKLLQEQIRQEKNTTQLVEQKLGAELKILKNQLHPHFLFNTLNNLYGMVLSKHPNAADVVVRLSDMMSYMLYECERELIDLEKEITNLQNYIELEKIRYGKRLDVSFEKSGEIKGKNIAPLLLLPFVENAFKHGVEKEETPSWVRINLWAEKSQLTFMVENSLPKNNGNTEKEYKTQSGVGLSNVKKRLALLYPEKHKLEIKKEDTFFVQLKLGNKNQYP